MILTQDHVVPGEITFTKDWNTLPYKTFFAPICSHLLPKVKACLQVLVS